MALSDLEINVQQALAAAIEAAQSAGRIIWEASQHLRRASAASVAATSLPSKPEGGGDAGCRKPEPGAAGDGKSPRPSRIAFQTKDSFDDLVTEYDHRCDAAILEVLERYNQSVLAEHPHLKFHFITEELNSRTALTNDLTWIVDPIDGTMSFVHGLPDCCVSIGLTCRKVPILAVVFSPFLVTGHIGVEQVAELRRQFETVTQPHPAQDVTKCSEGGALKKPPPPCPLPIKGAMAEKSSAAQRSGMAECVGELFTALKGQGCFLNGVRIRVNAAATPRTAMAVLNLPVPVKLSDAEAKEPEGVKAKIREAKQAKALDAVLSIRGCMSRDFLPGVRAYGSCAVTLSQIAAGRVDVYVEPGSKIWDVCAGALLVTEAGGVVTNIYGQPFDMTQDTTIIAAANEAMSSYASQLCKEHSLGQYWLVELERCNNQVVTKVGS